MTGIRSSQIINIHPIIARIKAIYKIKAAYYVLA